MSFLIKDIEMPELYKTYKVRFIQSGSGKLFVGMANENSTTYRLIGEVVPIAPHGDLIDRDVLSKQLGITDMHCLKCALGNYGLCTKGPEFVVACKEIEDAPTIIDAENK